ncbi:MAG: AAA family ATPase [Blastocatellia bacterium]
MATLDGITIEGFKSIRSLEDLELRRLNILVGANGAGKSNFVDFFRLLRAMSEGRLNLFVRGNGTADSFLFNGPKVTEKISGRLVFGPNQYQFELRPTVTGEFLVGHEVVGPKDGPRHFKVTIGGLLESELRTSEDEQSRAAYDSISSWVVYHFHDTSPTAGMRRVGGSVRDFRELRSDAGNLAAFLYRLKQTVPERYEQIRYHVQLIAPYFDDFLLEPEQSGQAELIRLEWRQKGSSMPMQPYQFSDGTIRFICLATALLQPTPPATIVIDEPELGLHPFALGLLASMLRQVSAQTQIIVSTQSSTLLDTFEPDEVIVVDRAEGASRFRRLEPEPLRDWLQDYSLGQLWQKNVISGSPVHE